MSLAIRPMKYSAVGSEQACHQGHPKSSPEAGAEHGLGPREKWPPYSSATVRTRRLSGATHQSRADGLLTAVHEATVAWMEPENLEDGLPDQPGVELKGDEAAWRQYAGKVVAVVNGEVRAVGNTWAEALRAVREANLTAPQMLYIPTGAFVG